MHKILNLILKDSNGKFKNGNKYLENLEVSTLPRIEEHIIINEENGQKLYRVVGILHTLGFNVEVLAVYDGNGGEVQQRLFNI